MPSKYAPKRCPLMLLIPLSLILGCGGQQAEEYEADISGKADNDIYPWDSTAACDYAATNCGVTPECSGMVVPPECSGERVLIWYEKTTDGALVEHKGLLPNFDACFEQLKKLDPCQPDERCSPPFIDVYSPDKDNTEGYPWNDKNKDACVMQSYPSSEWACQPDPLCEGMYLLEWWENSSDSAEDHYGILFSTLQDCKTALQDLKDLKHCAD